MTSRFRARRRAEVFADAVDGAAGRLRAQPREVSSLLEVVETLRAHDPAVPRDEFAADLRARLMLEADRVLTPEAATLRLPSRPRGARERRLVAAASALVLVGGTTTMAAAAQDALPGDALYPIKRGIERAESGLSMSSAGKGRDLLHQATDRLAEVRGLLASDSALAAPRVPDTLDEVTATATRGSDLLFESFRETRDPESIATVRQFAASGIRTLGQLAPGAPAEAQDELTEAALTLRAIDTRALELCDTCDGPPPVQVPGLILARAEVDRALDRASSDDLGSNSHPVAVPASLTKALRAAAAAEIIDVTSGAATSGDDDGGGTEGGEGDPTPTPEPLPSPDLKDDQLPNLIPGAQESTSGGTKDPGGSDTTDDLEGAVETLLPDLTDDDGGLLP